MLSIALMTVAALALLVSWRKDQARTKAALLIGCRSFMALIPSLLGMIALVGLALALTPPQVLSNLFGLHGPAGFALIALIGSIVTMPAPIAFPLAGSLLKLGAAPAVLATFVTTLTMVGIVTAPMEMSYFGKRFTIIRQSLSFILALLIGGMMGLSL